MPDIRIATGNDLMEIVLVQEGSNPFSVRRWGRRGQAPDMPAGQPAVDIVTVDSGRAPSTPRAVGGVVGLRMRYAGHTSRTTAGWNILEVRLREEGGGLEAVLTVETPPVGTAARSTVTVTNRADDTRALRSVTSLALSVALGTEASTRPDELVLASASCDWLGESRWNTCSLRRELVDLALGSHGGSSARGARSFSSTGSWSTGRVLPAGALLQDLDAGAGEPAAFAWQIESNGGWRWEVGENTHGSYLALAGPTDEDSQWTALLGPGESFTTVPATLAVGGGMEGGFAALTDFRRAARRNHPDNDRLPVVFNDYMNTLMGDPTTEKLLPLIDAAAEAGAEYFCVDAGWYDDSGDWWDSVGDWQPSTVRFPNGLDEVIDRIRDSGMVPGLWLEPEVVGVESPAADRLPAEAFFTRHGQRVVEHGRYHLDLRHPAAIAHLDSVVDRLVNDFGVGYFKLDYNINPGPGTDLDADSPGAGLLEHNRAHLAWLESVLDRHPRLVLENCASGAMRMDFAMLSRLQLQSTSDQQDPHAYPPIAAAAPLMMLPEQAANWAYPQPEMTDEELAFTLCTGMLGRMYLSGRVDAMNPGQKVLVSEAVAAHKRIRRDLAQGHASWPLGIDQWTKHWVALAIGTRQTRHLTLWRRRDGAPSIEVPLPDLAGRDILVDTVFPRRLQPWQFAWDKSRGVLTVGTGGTGPAARTLRISTQPATEVITVKAGETTGPVHGGATGMLYGLADDGIPAASLVHGARPRTMAQKAPAGLQHPNGDALELATGYFNAGGTEMLVYMQDVLAQWPYEEVGIERFCGLAQEMVAKAAARGDAHKFSWVPFNEGDWIWYSDWSEAGRERFLHDWARVHRAIRAVDPQARIVGPNEAVYNPRRIRDFFSFSLRHDVLPDVMSWHELTPASLERYPAHYLHYRALEAELGFGPLPINIDEYGNRRDMSNPAQLIQWIQMFESTKVDADLAYWTMAGNLDDHAVNTKQANAGWWLLHWYAGLRGETVAVDVPHPDVRDSLRALAAWDDAGQSLSVILGGTGSRLSVKLDGVRLAGPARLRISQVSWSGYEGDVAAPTLLRDECVTVQDGTLALTLPNSDPLAAYLVVLTPDGGGAVAEPSPWRCWVDSDAADAADASRVRHGDDPQHYTGSGREAVVLSSESSSLTFSVTVPSDGEYVLGLTYATDSTPVLVSLKIDAGPDTALRLPPTLSAGYAGRHDVPVRLAAGSHQITVAGTDGCETTIDGLSVAAAGTGSNRFDAVFAWRTGGTVQHAEAVHGSGSVLLGARDELTFHVGVPTSGRYGLTVCAGAGDGVGMAVDGRAVGGGRADVYLPAGISVVTVCAVGAGALVHSLTVAPAPSTPGALDGLRWAAGEFTLAGDARVDVEDGAAYLDGLTLAGGSPSGSASVELPALQPGNYVLTVEYSNADKATGHQYNADVINRKVQFRHGGSEPVTAAFRHNYHWANYQELAVPITLGEGPDSLFVEAVEGPAPRIAAVRLDRLVRGEHQ